LTVRARLVIVWAVTAYQNKHGRKGGRGIRHWLLIPKLVCISVTLGGFTAVEALIRSASLETPADWRTLVDTVGRIFRFAIVPGVLGVLLFGALLWWQHPKVFWQQRWFKVKLAALVVALPALHLSARSTLEKVRHEIDGGSPEGPTGLLDFFALHVEVAIVALVAVIVLGRVKPRLGRKPEAAPKPTSA